MMSNNREDNHSWNRDDRGSDRKNDRGERPSRGRFDKQDDRKPYRSGRSEDNDDRRGGYRRERSNDRDQRQGERGGRWHSDDRRDDRGGRRDDRGDRRDDRGERRGGYRRDNNNDRDQRQGERGGRWHSDDRRRGDNDQRGRGGNDRGDRRYDRGDRGERRYDRREERGDWRKEKDGRVFERVDGREERRSLRPRRNAVVRKEKGAAPSRKQADDGRVRLNKYIANAGICSRREADVLITTGLIQVNDKIVTELGTKINPEVDIIKYNGRTLKDERKVYLLLNKPKGFITTSDDPQERKTVMELIDGACNERVYPVGRLDRNTTGLLLFTNDGELTKKLTHPSFGASKVYNVELDRNITKKDMEILVKGVELEDGMANVDKIDYIMNDPIDKKKVGVSIHSGKNRIIRRLFESLGYEVKKLDRVYFAGLTKKNLLRGKYRFLTEQEIAFLKMDR
jgi:23S rRNA pseudouridine2605 synthase